MDKLENLLNKRNALERQLEACRWTNKKLIAELDDIEQQIEEMGKIEEEIPFNIITSIFEGGL